MKDYFNGILNLYIFTVFLIFVCVHFCISRHRQQMRDRSLSSVFRPKGSRVREVMSWYEWLPVIRWRTKNVYVCMHLRERNRKQRVTEWQKEWGEKGNTSKRWKHAGSQHQWAEFFQMFSSFSVPWMLSSYMHFFYIILKYIILTVHSINQTNIWNNRQQYRMDDHEFNMLKVGNPALSPKTQKKQTV